MWGKFMEKNTQYIIIACIVVVLLLLAGLAYMQGTQGNNATPTPTPAPAANATPTVTPTVTPTAIPGSAATQAPGVNATASPSAIPSATATPSSTPVVTPTTTPTATPTPTPTPSSTPVPDIDPYKKPGWPFYNKQYGPSVPTPNQGTITVIVTDGEDNPMEGQSVGVLAGSHDKPRMTESLVTTGTGGAGTENVGFKMVTPDTWLTTGSDGSAFLGSFDYGTYTVYYRYSYLADHSYGDGLVGGAGYYIDTETVVIDENNRNIVVNFKVEFG